MFSPPLCFTFLSKDEDFYLQHTLLVLSSVFVRRDSSVIKEEIKAFLANRRISQAVVAQVTGKSWRALYSGIWSSLCLLVQMLEYCLHFCIAVQICQLRHNNVCLWFKTHCLRYLGTSPVIFFYLVLVNFTAFVKSTKFPILWLKRILWFSCNCDRAYDTCTSNCFLHFIFLKALQSSKSTPWFYQLKKRFMGVKEVVCFNHFFICERKCIFSNHNWEDKNYQCLLFIFLYPIPLPNQRQPHPEYVVYMCHSLFRLHFLWSSWIGG